MNTKYQCIIMMLVLAACSSNSIKSDAYGNFETRETMLSVESPGKLIHLNVQQGDHVEKGMLLGMTDTTQFYYLTKQLKAKIKATSARKLSVTAQINVLGEQLKNLQIDQGRIKSLYQDQAATKKELDFIDGKVTEAQKKILSVKTQNQLIDRESDITIAQLEKAENLKEKCNIISPVSGVVLEKYLEAGEIAATGKPVLKMANLDTLILKVYISGSQLPHVKIGQQLDVVIDKTTKENQTLTGRVSWISPEAEFTPKIIQTKEERVKQVYGMKVRVKNDGRLKIGMPGEIRFRND